LCNNYRREAMSKFIKTNKKIEETVVSGYKNIEKGVVDSYKTVEEAVVNGYKKIENKFVKVFLTPEEEAHEVERDVNIRRQATEGSKDNE